MKRPQVVRIAEDVIGEILDEEAVLLHVGTGEYFALNRSGTRVWQLLQQHGDLEHVRAALCSEFDVDVETAEGDVAELVARLVDKGLLTIHEPLAE
ncbi:MAG TPA: PqqD family protein [Polyangiaceae bacterium]|nr:PqqD family protein [Polyangiaceae bacterium]